MIWRAPPGAALLVEPLDTLVAVFDRRSGITHLLAEPAPEILAALAGEGATIEQLRKRLASTYELTDADNALVTRLEELAAAGLVERG